MNFFSKLINWFLLFWRDLGLASRAVFSWVFVKIYLIVALAFNITSWVAMWLIYRNIAQDLTVLHYNVAFGIDLIGDRGQLFSNPELGLFFIVFDLIVLLLLSRSRDFKLFGHLLLAAAAFTNFLLALSIISVYLINFH
jgi:NADH:ubiquinone oxidoreductase subunit 3 (subunit A)